MKSILISAAALGLLLLNATAEAAWPWSKKSTAVPVAQTTGTPLINGKPVFTAAPGASTWDKFASGTKKVAVGTVDLVTLKPLRQKWSQPAAPQRTKAGYNVTPVKKESWVGSWFKPKPPEKKIKTVGDWMSQPTPRI